MTMHDIPWTGLAICCPISFVLGVRYGRFSVTHKEALMSLRVKLRELYDTLAPALFIALAIVATVGVWLGATASLQNGKDLVTNCQNANESREASRALWGYILDVSSANNPDATKAQKRFYVDFRDYIGAVYVPHDCSDLSKKYPLPSPPKVIVTKRHQHS